MASCLLKSECVNLEQKLYKMTWWATALNQITVPSGMNMAGGSVAVITTSGGIDCYRYNANASAWKKEANISDLIDDVDALAEKWLIETKEFDISDISASGTGWVSGTVAKEGYTPVGVLGWYCEGGTGNSALMPYSMKIYNNDLAVAFRNVSGATATGVKLQIDILYSKN